MNPPCSTCEGTDFTIENYERICTNCGDVQDELAEEGRLCMLPDNEAVVQNFRNKDFESNQRISQRMRSEADRNGTRRTVEAAKLKDSMLRVVKQFIKHPDAVHETMSLINSVLKAHQGRLLQTKKLGLAGACVYYLSAKHQLGISLRDICKATGIKMKTMSACLKQVRELQPDFEYERPNIKDLVKKFIDELSSRSFDLLSLDPEVQDNQQSVRASREPQPLVDPKDRHVLESRVMLLIDLYEAMSPYNQPSPQCLIKTALYHAWRSLDTFKVIAINIGSGIQSLAGESAKSQADDDEQLRRRLLIRVKHSICFEKFCQISNFNYNSKMHKMVSKLQASLLMLGKYLGNVNKMNLPWYLKDIIENSPHLIQEHMRAETET